MEKVDYLEFIKQLMEIKDLNERRKLIEGILVQDINLDLEMATVKMAIEDLNDLDSLFDSSQLIVEYYMKQSIVFFEIIRNYTLLNVKDNDSIENYSILLEEMLKENFYIKRVYNTIEKVYEGEKIGIIEDLSRAIKDLTDSEEINKITEDFETIFSEENKDKLKILQDIATYNDPAMKELKDNIYSMIPEGENDILNKETKKE